MRAIAKTGKFPGLSWVEVDTPQVTADNVIIKICRTGICGTDLHIWNWDTWAEKTIPTPLVIGHEFSGVVVDVGKSVKHIKVGQRVSGEGHLFEFNSCSCRVDALHLQPDIKCLGINISGAYSDYLSLPAINVIPLPEVVSFDLGAILDPLGNAVHAALSFPVTGENILITGSGPIGIMTAAICRHAGANHIVITDTSRERLLIAQDVVPGILAINVDQAPNGLIQDFLNVPIEFNIGLEMSGIGDAINQLIETISPGGKIACLGLPSKNITIDWSRIITKGLLLKGVYGREVFGTWRKMLSMLESGLSIDNIITHRFQAKDFEKGFAAAKSGTTGKIILEWS